LFYIIVNDYCERTHLYGHIQHQEVAAYHKNANDAFITHKIQFM